MTSQNKIMLLACGSFNPPTPMHLRLFEIARDYFHNMGSHQVVGGIISPVHDAYGKEGLAPMTHRLAMVKLALQSSDWIRMSDWESQQNGWSRTRNVIQYHQNYLNNYLKDGFNNNTDNVLPGWIPPNLRDKTTEVKVKILCGADLLESFAVPNLWKEEDLEYIIGQHGLVVITRVGSNPEQFIFNSDFLTRYQKNITLVTNWVVNDVSSTVARKFIRRGLSVKYLLDDLIIEYIKKHRLYQAVVLDNHKYSATNGTYFTKNDLLNNNAVQLNNDHIEGMDVTDSSANKRVCKKRGHSKTSNSTMKGPKMVKTNTRKSRKIKLKSN